MSLQPRKTKNRRPARVPSATAAKRGGGRGVGGEQPRGGVPAAGGGGSGETGESDAWVRLARATHAKLSKLNDLKAFVESLPSEDLGEKRWVLDEIDDAMCRLVLDCANRVD